MIKLETQCEGWISLSAFRKDENGEEVLGSRREPVPPFKNLITDGGLDRMGNNADWLTWCQVGSGTTTPAASDTALVSRVAGSNTTQAANSAVQSSAPYYASMTKTFRFATGVAAGNLAEVGIGWATTAALFSRARILDGGGSPTTITILPDELLDVTYQFRQYMPTVDAVSTIVLRGITYDYIGRASIVTSGSAGAGWGIAPNGHSAGTVSIVAGARAAYSGGIGAVTSVPSGTAFNSTSQTPQNYGTGNLYRDHVLLWDNNAGNIVEGIGACKLNMGIGAYQFGFTPNIPKTADDTLSLTFRHSWARKTL